MISTPPQETKWTERLRRRLLGLAARLAGLNDGATDPVRRGFAPIHPRGEQNRRQIGIEFIAGFHRALAHEGTRELVASLDRVSPEFRGFSYEGAAMAMALLDSLPFGTGGRHQQFLDSQQSRYPYTTHVGAGWALARTLWKSRLLAAPRDPLLGWLMIDGYGFHQAYFHWRRLESTSRWFPRSLSAAQRHVFMQGVGRCLWFIEGGVAEGVGRHVARFPDEFHGDLWSGVALAAVYAGDSEAGEVDRLKEAGARYRAELAQGAAFAAKACLQGGFISGSAAESCRILCECPAEEAAMATDLALRRLDSSAPDSYARWRELVQEHFSPASIMAVP